MALKLFRTTEFAQSSLFSLSSQRDAVHPAWVIVLCSLWVATACNVPLWRELMGLAELDNLRGLAFAAGFGVVIAASTAALLSLLSWRWTLKPVVTVTLLAAAFGAYFMLAYGVVIDTTMVTNVLQTDMRETRDLLNLRLFFTVLVLALLPILWLWRTPVRRLGWARRLLQNILLFAASVVLLGGTLLLIYQDFSSIMRNHTQLRYLINPLNSFYALADLASKPFQRDTSVLLAVGEDARFTPWPAKPPLVVLVLGETGRSGNFSLNGYSRPTNPELAATDVVSFRNAWSCGTSTAASVPCMFSHLGRQEFDSRRANYENLLDVLQRAGLAVLWVDNQSGCKGVCDRVPNVSTSQLQVPGLCDGGECFDEVMLRGLDERIAALPAERRARGVVLVLHQMGSHGPAYYKRSPAAYKKFLPECTSNALQDCGREQVVNAYDNTVVYTDHFLASVVKWLKVQDQRSSTAMLYVADHGESLGENNLYLHGLPYAIAPDVQKHVPWITWLSPGYEQAARLSSACLRTRRDEAISHDNYFHSVLGLLHVQTALYQPALDMFHPCVKP